MNLDDLKRSVDNDTPPKGISKLCKAMWYDAKEDWDTAHQIAQSVDSRDGSWVHAYLHRKEGDISNASYWYHMAGRKMPQTTSEEEWKEIALELIKTCMEE